MKKYRVGVTYEGSIYVEVEAEDEYRAELEAKQKVEKCWIKIF